jgi:small subunit ribosomal protein S16
LAVKIRLKRSGMPKQPTYRVVVCDSRKPRDGEVLENIGYYAPYKQDKPLDIDIELYQGWLNRGAQPTEAVKRLIKDLRKKGRTAESGGKPAAREVREEPPAEAPSAEEAPAARTSVEAMDEAE